MQIIYKQHYVTEMDETMIQRCVFCGEIITDYRNASYPLEQGKPKGFSEGFVFISNTKNPQIFKTVTTLYTSDPTEKCK